MAVLLQAADIIEAMRSETAQLSEEARVLGEKTRFAAVRSLHSRDNSIISMTGSSDDAARDRANEDWRVVTEDWERELEAIQSDLFRTKSPELATLQVWALTRLSGSGGLRAGLDVLAAMFEIFAKGAAPERWEMLPSIDTGDREDVLPRTLGRSQFLGGPMVLGGRTSIDRVDRHARGEPDPAVATALEQEFSALVDDQIRALEALCRETADRILAVRGLATAAGVADCSNMFEASRVLLFSAAKIVRSKAPDQFAPETASDAAAPAGGAGGAGGSARADNGAWEEGYLAARERKFRELESIGSWFRRFEPHNPIGHVLPSLVKRAGMDLPGLVAEAEIKRSETPARLLLSLVLPEGDSGQSSS